MSSSNHHPYNLESVKRSGSRHHHYHSRPPPHHHEQNNNSAHYYDDEDGHDNNYDDDNNVMTSSADLTTSEEYEARRTQEFDKVFQSWQITQDNLKLRRKLMKTNQQEVQRIVAELSKQHDEALAIKDDEVAHLTKQLKRMQARFENERSKLVSTANLLQDELTRKEERCAELEHDNKQITKENQDAQADIATLIERAKSARRDHETAQQQLEAMQRETATQSNHHVELQNVIANLHSQIAYLQQRHEKQNMDVNAMQVEMYRSERSNEDLGVKLATSAQQKSLFTQSKIDKLEEIVDGLIKNNRRLLHIMGNSRELGRYLNFTGEHMQYLGDSYIAGRGVESWERHGHSADVDALLLQDLRTAVNEHRNQATALFPSNNDNDKKRRNQQRQVVKLNTEADYWIPARAFHLATMFRERYFAEKPVELWHTLIVELAHALRDSNAIPKPYAVSSHVISAGPTPPPPSATTTAPTNNNNKPSSASSSKQQLREIMSDQILIESIRSIAGLKSLKQRLDSATPVVASERQDAKRILIDAIVAVEQLLLRTKQYERECQRSLGDTNDRRNASTTELRGKVKAFMDEWCSDLIRNCNDAANICCSSAATIRAINAADSERLEQQQQQQQQQEVKAAAMSYNAAAMDPETPGRRNAARPPSSSLLTADKQRTLMHEILESYSEAIVNLRSAVLEGRSTLQRNLDALHP